MNEQERKASEELADKIKGFKLSCFDYLKIVKQASPEELKIMGYRGKTNAEAMMMAYDSYQERIDSVTKEFLKLYPDE